VLRIVIACKSPSPRPGLNPQTLSPMLNVDVGINFMYHTSYWERIVPYVEVGPGLGIEYVLCYLFIYY
jgi:hypothetical protein